MIVSAVGRMEVQCAVTSSDIQSEDDQGGEMECDEDPQNWQSLVSHDILASLSPQEIKRQEVINGNDHTPPASQSRQGVPCPFTDVCVCVRAVLH